MYSLNITEHGEEAHERDQSRRGNPDVVKPLAGFKILDISNFLAAPMCSMFLADFGADVLKVERPEHGDEVRHWGENRDGVGLYYKVLNRGKRSITLDLRTPFGAETVKRLVRDADVIVENYRTAPWRSGGSATTCSARSTRASSWSALPLGPDGAAQPAAGLRDARRGLCRIRGDQRRTGPAAAPAGLRARRFHHGLMAAFLTVTALHEAKRSGRGQVIDLAIYETLLTLLGRKVVNYDQLGLVQQRSGSRLPFTAPRNTYRTRTGSTSPSRAAHNRPSCASARRSAYRPSWRILASRPNRARLVNAAVLDEHLQAAIERFDGTICCPPSFEIGATAAPVNTVADIVDDPHVQRGRTSFPLTIPNSEAGCGCRTWSASSRARRARSRRPVHGSASTTARCWSTSSATRKRSLPRRGSPSTARPGGGGGAVNVPVLELLVGGDPARGALCPDGAA